MDRDRQLQSTHFPKIFDEMVLALIISHFCLLPKHKLGSFELVIEKSFSFWFELLPQNPCAWSDCLLELEAVSQLSVALN
jgi:hypothetical protein